MNRIDALRILGLNEGATQDDIKAAWRESAQILHPDRFAGNKKLQDRATEQFKTLQEAYDFLTKGKGSNRKRTASDKSAGESHAGGYQGSSRYTDAQIAGIVAARTQLVKQRDAVADERRLGLILLAAGGLVAFATLRRPYGLFGVLAALGSAAAVWGAVQAINSIKTIGMLDERIAELKKEEARLRSILEKEEED